jgi:putative cell wall-binding protein
MFRRGLWTKFIFLGTMISFALFVPAFPSSWAKNPAVKILAEEVRHEQPDEFARGDLENLAVRAEGKQAELSVESGKRSGVYVSPVIKSRIVFTDVGVHWKDRSSFKKWGKPNELIKIAIRTSRDGKTWSSWKVVEVDEIEGPDHRKSEETFSKLIYGDRGRYIQYRIEMDTDGSKKPRIRDFKLTLINSEDGGKVETMTSLADILFKRAKAAFLDKPEVVSRAEWGADESLRYNSDGTEKWPREYDQVTHLVVHHTDTPVNDPDPAARVRSIYYYHTVTRNYGDIGYNAIIGSDGRIYEGRKGEDGDVLTPGVVGAHAYSFNYGSFGVAVMGTYESTALPDSLREKLIQLLAYQADLHGIDPLGKADFVRDYEYDDPNVPPVDKNVPTLLGHGNLPRASTQCPGDYIVNHLTGLRSDVGAAMRMKRLDGRNRYEVSVAISKEIGTSAASDTVVLARGDMFTDALSGGPLAHANHAPILLTTTDKLQASVKEEIKRRRPKKAIILGGTLSVSTYVEEELRSLGVQTIKRIDGRNRYAVSAGVAEQLAGVRTTDTAFVVSGQTYPDALSASSIAAQKGSPILMVTTDSVPSSIESFIKGHPEIKKFIIVGGPLTVSDNVKSQLSKYGTVTRISGSNRYDVNVNVVKHFNMSLNTVVFARGDMFTDALSGGPLAALSKGPLLLTKPEELHPKVNDLLKERPGEMKRAYLLGGTKSISTKTEKQIRNYLK